MPLTSTDNRANLLQLCFISVLNYSKQDKPILNTVHSFTLHFRKKNVMDAFLAKLQVSKLNRLQLHMLNCIPVDKGKF